jgi:hypothetical protein
MSVGEIPQGQMIDYPDFNALVLTALLFKLGGQITLSIEDLSSLSREYPKIRIALQIPHEGDPIDRASTAQVTLTLLAAHGGSYGQESEGPVS